MLSAKASESCRVSEAEVKVKEEGGKKAFTRDNPIVASIKPRGTALTTPEQAKAMARKRRGMASEFAEDIADAWKWT